MRAKPLNLRSGPLSQRVKWYDVESTSGQYFWCHRIRVADDLSLDTGFLITLGFISTVTKHILEEGEKRSGLCKYLLEQLLPPRTGIRHQHIDNIGHLQSSGASVPGGQAWWPPKQTHALAPAQDWAASRSLP